MYCQPSIRISQSFTGIERARPAISEAAEGKQTYFCLDMSSYGHDVVLGERVEQKKGEKREQKRVCAM